MRRTAIAALLLAIPLFAWASTYDDVLGMLADPNVKPLDIVAKINGSTDPWYPHHVYELIDKKAPKEVTAAVAAKAAVFYDGSQLPLDEQGAAARKTAPAQTIAVNSAEDLVMVFEFYNDVKNEIDAGKAAAGPAPTQNQGEMQGVFDKRYRAWQETVVAGSAAAEGKIDQTDFMIKIPATIVDDPTGCKHAKVEFELPNVGFMLFRTAMGANLVLYDVKLTASPTIAKVQWAGEGKTRLLADSWPICGDAMSEIGAPVRLEITMKRTFKGGDWTGKGGFIGSNGPIPAKKK